jgi:queuine tRNA-ribosyltransferase
MAFLIKEEGKTGRQGVLQTRRGEIQTPFFMPDATRASVRGVVPEELKKAGTDALVVNTYHLLLQPGAELVAKAGGIHSFMHWDGPVLADSGGYQVFSLIHKNPELGKITEDGAEFRSPVNGKKYLLTPERSIQIQFDLGVDMMVCLDDPRPNDVSYEEMEESVERSIRWALRCKDEFMRQMKARKLTSKTSPLIFGVVQGGKEKDLRTRCAEALTEIGFNGYGFGGRHIDENGEFLAEIAAHTASVIPEEAPRFALGVGTPADIVRFFAAGWDMFDCVIPTREGRHGRLFLWSDYTGVPGPENLDFYTTINIRNEQFKEDLGPVDRTCACDLCKNYSRAYLRHLFVAGEPLALRLASIHNLRFYARLMQKLQNP